MLYIAYHESFICADFERYYKLKQFLKKQPRHVLDECIVVKRVNGVDLKGRIKFDKRQGYLTKIKF